VEESRCGHGRRSIRGRYAEVGKPLYFVNLHQSPHATALAALPLLFSHCRCPGSRRLALLRARQSGQQRWQRTGERIQKLLAGWPDSVQGRHAQQLCGEGRVPGSTALWPPASRRSGPISRSRIASKSTNQPAGPHNPRLGSLTVSAQTSPPAVLCSCPRPRRLAQPFRTLLPRETTGADRTGHPDLGAALMPTSRGALLCSTNDGSAFTLQLQAIPVDPTSKT